MNKVQILAIIAAVALFLGLYFGFDTKPDKQKTIERSRSLQGESTSFESMLEDANSHLSALQAADVISIGLTAPPTLEVEALMVLVTGMLGLGTARTVEKIKGKA